ncbi:helix-turn-helix domain-containing protein [Kitasatospora sp. NPDC057223]|uniref:helix-turn-helix domain-containing protein n=1 Tax=Kitasatospora sp. NPDC057223 TaxID=3346055 RepID=UPI0036344339
MTLDYTDERTLLGGHLPVWNSRLIAALRIQRGWTQEELAEYSGLSVRTIRNLELGRVQNPRRSSVDLLVTALGVADEQRQSAENLDRARWRGLPAANSALVGSPAEHQQLANTVRTNRLTTFLGPGGVGKTRMALSVAAQISHFFRDGVELVELGDLRAEHDSRDEQAMAVLHRVRRQLGRGRPGAQSGAAVAEIEAETNMLLVLDNAEHIPAGVMAATRELQANFAGVHILITARRRLTERLGANREIQPLPLEQAPGEPLSGAPAVELFLQHVGTESRAAAELEKDLPLIAELCRRLGGVPRYIEFAAECLRAIPIRLMLSYGPTPEMLWSNDHALLRHQRSVTDSILWSIGLLGEEHRLLLERIAALPTRRFVLDEITAEYDRLGRGTSPNPLTLVSDLLDTSLLLPDPAHHYHYRAAPFVAEVVQRLAAARPTAGPGGPAGIR